MNIVSILRSKLVLTPQVKKLNACVLLFAAFNLTVYEFFEITIFGDYSLTEISNMVRVILIILFVLIAVLLSWTLKENDNDLLSFLGWLFVLGTSALSVLIVSSYLETEFQIIYPLTYVWIGDLLSLLILGVVWLENYFFKYFSTVPDEW